MLAFFHLFFEGGGVKVSLRTVRRCQKQNKGQDILNSAFMSKAKNVLIVDKKELVFLC